MSEPSVSVSQIPTLCEISVSGVENSVMYLTREGAKRLTGDPLLVNLPVVPTNLYQSGPSSKADINKPVLDFLYGPTFVAYNSAYIGSGISEDAFTSIVPSEEAQRAAILRFDNRINDRK